MDGARVHLISKSQMQSSRFTQLGSLNVVRQLCEVFYVTCIRVRVITSHCMLIYSIVARFKDGISISSRGILPRNCRPDLTTGRAPVVVFGIVPNLLSHFDRPIAVAHTHQSSARSWIKLICLNKILQMCVTIYVINIRVT